MGKVLHITTTSDEYKALTSKNSDAIYFVEDTQEIYKGETLFAQPQEDEISYVTSVPSYDEAEEGVVYVVNDGLTVTLYVKGDTEMTQVGGTVTSDDVSEAITTALANDTSIEKVESSTTDDGTVLTFTAKDGSTQEVTIADIFLSAADYDSETHILKLTVTGADDPVEVDLSDLIDTDDQDASEVEMSRSITATVSVGNISKGDVIDVTDLQSLLEAILSQDSNPTTTQPSAKVTLTSAGAKEVGTSFTPSYSVTFSAGSYSDNASGTQETGVTATAYEVTDTNSNSATTASGSFDSFTVEDDTSYYVSATVSYSDGNVPTTYLGEDYEEGQITAGTCSATSSKVTGYRAGFYGVLTEKDSTVDSDLVRSLTSTGKAVSKGQTYTITVSSGTLRVIVAYPATIGEIASITSAEQFGSEISASFDLYTIDVNDASGSNAISYYVYVKDLASAQSTDTTYTVTI